jgi:hypothetical protein
MSPSRTAALRSKEGPKIGRLPPRTDPRALMFARYATAPRTLPKRTSFWADRAPFPEQTFGNTQYNDCTRASQAMGAMRMERIESRRTPQISDDEVVRVYLDMETRLYGGGDGGAYLVDALSEWRRPELTFHDHEGRALTIDSYTRINDADQDEVRQAIWTAGSHGIAIGLSLPKAFKDVMPPNPWDVPQGQALIGDWLPNSWGGHAMWARDYDERGIWVVHTWGRPDQLLTWAAAAAYLDEAYLVIDSHDYWRTKKPRASRYLDLAGIKRAVNKASSYPIA